MDTFGLIVGIGTVAAGLNNRYWWYRLKRDGRFRLDPNGDPTNYGLLVRISWIVVGTGIAFIAASLIA